jgi:hypothetical protein
MSLLDRLSGAGAPKLPVHQFQGSLQLWALGLVTRANVISAFTISSDEESDLDFLKTKHDAALNKDAFLKGVDSVLMLAEQSIFGLDNQATFVSAINDLALIPVST